MKDTQEKEAIFRHSKGPVDVADRGGLFGEPNVQPRRQSCPIHGPIASRRIDWQGTEPRCPDCGKVLETDAGGQDKT
jgi:hypothetical protein